MNKRILFINNYTATSTVPELIAGADYFMRKSFGTLELFARINSLLQRVPYNKSITLAY